MKVNPIKTQSERINLNGKLLLIINEVIKSSSMKVFGIKVEPQDCMDDTIVEVKLISNQFPEREVRVRETFQKGLEADHPRYNPANPIGDNIMSIITGKLAEFCMTWNLANAVQENDEVEESENTVIFNGKEVDTVTIKPVPMFAKRDTLQECMDYAEQMAKSSESYLHTLTPVMVLLNTIACNYILIDREEAGLGIQDNSIAVKKKD
jgi:hypothetical protein